MTCGAWAGAPAATSGVPSGGTNDGSSGSRPTTLGRTPPTFRSLTKERRARAWSSHPASISGVDSMSRTVYCERGIAGIVSRAGPIDAFRKTVPVP